MPHFMQQMVFMSGRWPSLPPPASQHSSMLCPLLLQFVQNLFLWLFLYCLGWYCPCWNCGCGCACTALLWCDGIVMRLSFFMIFSTIESLSELEFAVSISSVTLALIKT